VTVKGIPGLALLERIVDDLVEVDLLLAAEHPVCTDYETQGRQDRIACSATHQAQTDRPAVMSTCALQSIRRSARASAEKPPNCNGRESSIKMMNIYLVSLTFIMIIITMVMISIILIMITMIGMIPAIMMIMAVIIIIRAKKGRTTMECGAPMRAHAYIATSISGIIGR
jgi:hypothetical protein